MKLKHLLGARYNSLTDEAKISCELHPTAARNKRHIGDIVERLLDEVKNGKDTFEDVPLDLRHMRGRMEKERKRLIQFPEEWKLTEERRRMLAEQWKMSERKQVEATEQGLLVSGEEATQRVKVPLRRPEAETVPVQQRAAPLPRARTTLR